MQCYPGPEQLRAYPQNVPAMSQLDNNMQGEMKSGAEELAKKFDEDPWKVGGVELAHTPKTTSRH